MKIRKATRKDKKQYMKTQKEAFPTIDSKRDSKFFDEKIKKKEIFILEVDKEYAGHICFGWHKYNPPFAGSIFIEEFAIKKKFRGRGLGIKLMEQIVKFCKKKKIAEIILGTGDFRGNKAIKFYEKQGFKKVGWLKDLPGKSEYDYNEYFYAIKVKDWKKR
jgi:ribosomal protein S18 acetylase RimI-like enzyme